MDFLRTLLQDIPRDRPSVVFDIGANEGGYTHLIRQHLPEARIFAYEPLPVMYEQLEGRFGRTGWERDPGVTVYRLGVSDRHYEDAGFAVHEAWTIDKPAQARRGRNATYGGPVFDVEFTTVDREMQEICTGDRLDFLKIDTDGYELRVLRGARETILRDRPPILIELGYLVEDLGDSIADFLNFIYLDLNYRLYTQDGTPLDLYRYRDWYPFTTTFDVAMLPVETPLRPLD